MIPVRTAASNMVYRGPTPDIGDAWAERGRGAAYLIWELTDEERAAIVDGANLRLGVFQNPMPPVSLETTGALALTPEGTVWCDRGRKILRGLFPSAVIPSGYWLVSTDVWEALQRDGALHSDRPSGIPLFCTRPLMQGAELPADTLEYAVAGLDGQQ